MNFLAYTDHRTWDALDDALEQIARQRELNLTSSTSMLSVLASMRLQITEMLEYAIAESDIGHDVTVDDIANALGVTPSVALQRYTPNDHPF